MHLFNKSGLLVWTRQPQCSIRLRFRRAKYGFQRSTYLKSSSLTAGDEPNPKLVGPRRIKLLVGEGVLQYLWLVSSSQKMWRYNSTATHGPLAHTKFPSKLSENHLQILGRKVADFDDLILNHTRIRDTQHRRQYVSRIRLELAPSQLRQGFAPMVCCACAALQ
jgi:hypothetical protein